jgi:hypothetical protein
MSPSLHAHWQRRCNHRINGVTKAQFDGFFAAIGKVFRASLGDEWTAAIDQPGGAR